MINKNLEKKICIWKGVVKRDKENYGSFSEKKPEYKKDCKENYNPLNCIKCDGYDENCHVYKSLQKNGFLSVADS